MPTAANVTPWTNPTLVAVAGTDTSGSEGVTPSGKRANVASSAIHALSRLFSRHSINGNLTAPTSERRSWRWLHGADANDDRVARRPSRANDVHPAPDGAAMIPPAFAAPGDERQRGELGRSMAVATSPPPWVASSPCIALAAARSTTPRRAGAIIVPTPPERLSEMPPRRPSLRRVVPTKPSPQEAGQVVAEPTREEAPPLNTGKANDTRPECATYQQAEMCRKKEVCAAKPHRLSLEPLEARQKGSAMVDPLESPSVSSGNGRSWQAVVASHQNELTAFEQDEITRYAQVDFVSTMSIKQQRLAVTAQENVSALVSHDTIIVHPPSQECNHGFDDARGEYLMIPGDHLHYRYEVLYELGCGAFGQVVCCLDHRTARQVAVKVVRNHPKYADQAKIEIQVLQHLRDSRSKLEANAGWHASRSSQFSRKQSWAETDVDDGTPIVQMLDSFQFRNHVCITFELLGMNLYDYLKLRYFQGMPLDNLRVVARQLLHALSALHAARVIHCDLKPENILIRSPLKFFLAGKGHANAAHAAEPVTAVSLVDFGSGCLVGSTIHTYVQSRFYRSPEVILRAPYSTPVDMWSFGCILVELYTGHPLFAGENEQEQLQCIMEVLGMPPLGLLARCKRYRQFFQETEVGTWLPKPFVNSRGRRRAPGRRPLEQIVGGNDASFLYFLRRCLSWEPAERMTPTEALHDPWIAERAQPVGRA